MGLLGAPQHCGDDYSRGVCGLNRNCCKNVQVLIESLFVANVCNGFLLGGGCEIRPAEWTTCKRSAVDLQLERKGVGEGGKGLQRFQQGR